MDSKSRSEFFNTQKADAASGFALNQSGREQVLSERSKDHLQNPGERVISNSGPLVPPVECRDRLGSQHVEATNQVGRFSQSFGEAVRKHDRRRQSQIPPGAYQADYGRINAKETSLVQKHSTLFETRRFE